MTVYGYAGQILDIDLSNNKIDRLATSDYTDRFLGGRGIAAKLYWDKTRPETAAYDEKNCLVFMTGPVAGFMGFSGCRWQICGKSPEMEPEAFSYANLGGSWGAWLKYAGFDGIAVSGKADKPAYILITDDMFEIKDASHLWGKTTVETEDILHTELGKDTRILSIGPAGENRVTFATLLASENASGASGFGGVMGAKNLKAIVIKADNRKRPVAAEPERVKELAALVRHLRITNFEDYGHFLPGRMKLTSCYGCISGCTRSIYRADNGRIYKSFCQAAGV
jgi:aldehyde:ferredoxin oxidoreductase